MTYHMNETAPAAILPACGCTPEIPCLDHIEAASNAVLARPAPVCETELREAMAYLNAKDDLIWTIAVPAMDRLTFAMRTIEAGQDMRDAWEDALANA